MTGATKKRSWLLVRVELLGREHDLLEQPPGRVLLVGPRHTFAHLAEAIDTAFARWDRGHLHEFAVADGRRLGPLGDDDDDELVDDRSVTVSSVAESFPTFSYTFDLGEGWLHHCHVERTGVDPMEEHGTVPMQPVPVFGWGAIPDQHGRVRDDEGDDVLLDAEMEAYLDELAAADRAMAEDLRSAVPEVFAADPPADELAFAASRLREEPALAARLGYDVPDDDGELVVLAGGALVSLNGESGLELELEAMVVSLELADWFGAVVSLVREGVGASADEDDVVARIESTPELEGELEPDDVSFISTAFFPVVRSWQDAGCVDADRRLTALGWWALPRALVRAWEADQ